MINLIGVYGEPDKSTKNQRTKINKFWTEDMSKLMQQMDEPPKKVWLIGGDLNVKEDEEDELGMAKVKT